MKLPNIMSQSCRCWGAGGVVVFENLYLERSKRNKPLFLEFSRKHLKKKFYESGSNRVQVFHTIKVEMLVWFQNLGVYNNLFVNLVHRIVGFKLIAHLLTFQRQIFKREGSAFLNFRTETINEQLLFCTVH